MMEKYYFKPLSVHVPAALCSVVQSLSCVPHLTPGGLAYQEVASFKSLGQVTSSVSLGALFSGPKVHILNKLIFIYVYSYPGG